MRTDVSDHARPQQVERPDLVELTQKRRLQAIKECKGAVQLVYDQVASGGHAHWE